MPVHEPRAVEVIFIFHCIFLEADTFKGEEHEGIQSSRVSMDRGGNVQNEIYTFGNYHRSFIGLDSFGDCLQQ